jgi:hypothetical protein
MPRQHPGSGNRVNHTKPQHKKDKQKSHGANTQRGARKCYGDDAHHHACVQKQDRSLTDLRSMNRIMLSNMQSYCSPNAGFSNMIYFPAGVAEIIMCYTADEYCGLNPCMKHCTVAFGAGYNSCFIFNRCAYQPPHDYLPIDRAKKLWVSLVVITCLQVSHRAMLMQPSALGFPEQDGDDNQRV